MSIWELCKCGEGEICSFCKALTFGSFVATSALIGYFIGRRRRQSK